MSPITVSPKFQIVIPKQIREQMKIKPGMKLSIVAYDNTFTVVPIRPMKEMRGFLKGIDTTVIREPFRKL